MNSDIDSKDYWNNRYRTQSTGWDIGYASPAIVEFFNSIEDKNTKILVPGAGNGHELIYAHDLGFNNIHLLDIADEVCASFINENQSFDKNHVHCQNFFDFDGQFDVIIEQTFFCAIHPSFRKQYVQKMAELLKPQGKLMGLLFNCEFENGPPFGGNVDEYVKIFEPYFDFEIWETCENSIPARAGREWRFLIKKK